MDMTDLAIVVLAAGMGTRMKSALPKVLHKVANRSMVGHVLAAAAGLAPKLPVVVHGPSAEMVRAESRKFFADCQFAAQVDRLGTGHAVSMAREALLGFNGTVLVLYGDVPLIQTSTLQALLANIDAKHPMAVLGFEAANPHGYGRLIQTGSGITAIREQLDASPTEQHIKLCNSGIIAIESKLLWQLVPKLNNANAKNEYYLTDLVGLTVDAGFSVALCGWPVRGSVGGKCLRALARHDAGDGGGLAHYQAGLAGLHRRAVLEFLRGLGRSDP